MVSLATKSQLIRTNRCEVIGHKKLNIFCWLVGFKLTVILKKNCQQVNCSILNALSKFQVDTFWDIKVMVTQTL